MQRGKKKVEFKSITISRPIRGVCSSYGIWLNGVGGKNKCAPLCYFKKPKWLNEKEYKEIMERVVSTLNNDL